MRRTRQQETAPRSPQWDQHVFRDPGSRIPLGRWAGITVDAHWSVLATAILIATLVAMQQLPRVTPGYPALVYWLVAVGVAVLFLATLLAHELAHAIVARRYGVQVEGITLWLLGGMTRFTAETPNPRAELAIALAGPLTSLASGGLFTGFAAAGWALRLPAVVLGGLSWLALINVLICVFNLLPGAPLDGGRVLHALLWRRSRSRDRATANAARVGTVLGALLGCLGVIEMFSHGLFVGLWLILLGWFLMTAASGEASGAALVPELARVRVRDVMTAEPVTAPGWLTVHTFLDRFGWSARQRVFPVVDFELRPCGVVCLTDLQRLSVDDRVTRRVSDVCRPLGTACVLAPDDPFRLALSTRLRAGRDLTLVVQDGRLLGVISAADIARTLELAVLHQPMPREPGSPEVIPTQRASPGA